MFTYKTDEQIICEAITVILKSLPKTVKIKFVILCGCALILQMIIILIIFEITNVI